MGFIAWIILGLVAGILAKVIMPGKDPGGWFITILLGIGGAFVGGWLGKMSGIGDGEGMIESIITATIGAVVLLFLHRVITKKRASPLRLTHLKNYKARFDGLFLCHDSAASLP